jgi:hypothetical protein
MQLLRYAWILLLPVISVCVFAGLHLAVGTELFRADTAASTQAGASIVVDATRHDFGQAPAGTLLRHEFVISNRGDRRIVLNEVGCPGCGDNVMDDSVIVPPGGQWRMPVSLETTGRCGPLRRVVTITTSDPRRPQIEFTLSARVAAEGERAEAQRPPGGKSVLRPGPGKRESRGS